MANLISVSQKVSLKKQHAKEKLQSTAASMKLILLVAFTVSIAGARFHSQLEDELIKELVDEYSSQDPSSHSYQPLNYDPRFCADTGLTCHQCAECHDALQFGLCVDGATTSKCLCKWGWTGPNAQRVIAPNEVSEWSRNRIRADNCKTPCHYTHDFWNGTCIGHPSCDEYKCKAKHYGYAKCVHGKCVPDCDEPACKAKHNGYAKCIKGKCIPDCIESVCRAKHNGYAKCINWICVPDCDETACKAKHNGYARCINGKCVPDCDETACKAKHYGYARCINGKCVPDCDETACKAKHYGYAKCINGKCVPDCDEPACKAKHYGYAKCINGKCVPDCNEPACKAKHYGYAKCINGTCVPDCNPTACALKYGVCEKGKCVPTCDEHACAAKGGKCFKGVCKIKCCRGSSGPNAIYIGSEDTYYADNCDTPCPYLGTGVPNPGCMKQPPLPPPCDPRCAKTGGQCNIETGKCACCKDFTGPNPVYDPATHTISADYCDTYCPYKVAGKSNHLCINPNYISRCSVKITY